MFLVMATTTTALIAAYWLTFLEPELRSIAFSEASAIAQSQAHTFEDVLSGQADAHRRQNLQDAIDKMLLLTDSNTQQAFTLGILLEFDLDMVPSSNELLDLHSGQTVCSRCIVTAIPLFSRKTKELFGIANFYMNDASHHQLLANVRNQFIIGAVVLICFVFISWRFARSLVHPLLMLAASLPGTRQTEIDAKNLSETEQVNALNKPTSMGKYSLDNRLPGFVSREILIVKQAIDNMFDANNRQLEALINAKDYTENILESMRDVLLVVNAEGTIETVNHFATRILGYTRKELVGKQVDDILLHTESILTLANRYGGETAGDDKSTNIEAGMLCKNGTQLPVLLSHARRRSRVQESKGLICVAKDISDLKKAEKSLYLTQACVDHTAEAVFWVDQQAHFFFVNHAACESLGYSKSELLALKVFDIAPEFSADRWPTFWNENKTKGSNHFESIHRRKDGTEFDVEAESNYLIYEGREVLHVYIRDITERRKTERAVKELNEKLESRVEERTAELKAAQLELVKKERLAALGQLTAIVSHELRNPLGSIRSSIYVIGMKLKDKGLGLEKALDRVDRSITRCDTIIGELLEYTRIKSLSPVMTEFDSWLSNVLEELVPPDGIKVVYRANAPGKINLDSERFRRAIINLFDNSIQAIQEKNDLDSKKNYVTITTAIRNRHVELVVEDTGTGIKADDMDKVFEPLYSTKGFGAGLGLSIVKQIVEQHGGNMEVSSVVGTGTRFVINLPTETVESIKTM